MRGWPFATGSDYLITLLRAISPPGSEADLLDYIGLAVIVTDAQGHITFWNAEAESLYGWSFAEVQGRQVLETTPSATSRQQAEELMACLLKGDSWSGELEVKRKDGTKFTAHVTNSPLLDASGKLVGVIGVSRDASKEAEARQQLTDSHTLYHDLVNRVPGAVILYRVKPDGTDDLLFASDNAQDLWGVSAAEAMADASLLWDGILEEDRPGMKASVEKSAQSMALWRHEYRIRTPDGQLKWLQGNGTPSRRSDGSIVWHSLILDITPLKLVEQELREANTRLLLAAEASDIGFWDWNLTSGLVSRTVRLHEQLGLTPAELAPTHEAYLERVHPEDRPLLIELIDDLQEGRRDNGHVEIRLRHKDGSWRWILRHAATITDGSGKLERIIGTNVDITERKRHEREVAQNERLESIGLLAGGLAHDFNNLLAEVFGNVDLARLDLERSHPAYELLDDALAPLDRARKLTSQLLTFAKGGSPITRPISLPDFVQKATREALADSPVALRTDHIEEGLYSEVDPDQLQQVINHIIDNAKDILGATGFVSLSIRSISMGSAPVQPAPSAGCTPPPGNYARVSFRDNGCGIAADKIEHVLEPYFSSTPGKQGLGLPIVATIMRRHGGSLLIESKEGSGTEVHLYFPLPEGQVDNEQPSGQPSATAQRTGDPPDPRKRILLMDDEVGLLRMASRILGRAGYNVVTAESGEQAVREFRRALVGHEPFDLLIFDLMVPGGMGGQEALKEIRKLDPRVHAIVSSGYSSDPIMADFAKHGFQGRVPKPYTTQQLRDEIERVLALQDF